MKRFGVGMASVGVRDHLLLYIQPYDRRGGQMSDREIHKLGQAIGYLLTAYLPGGAYRAAVEYLDAFRNHEELPEGSQGAFEEVFKEVESDAQLP